MEYLNAGDQQQNQPQHLMWVCICNLNPVLLHVGLLYHTRLPLCWSSCWWSSDIWQTITELCASCYVSAHRFICVLPCTRQGVATTNSSVEPFLGTTNIRPTFINSLFPVDLLHLFFAAASVFIIGFHNTKYTIILSNNGKAVVDSCHTCSLKIQSGHLHRKDQDTLIE